MNVAFPYGLDSRGRTATANDEDHIRQMVEQLLLTSPGERVNRPDFGTGLLQLVFAPNSPELAAAIQFSAQGALQKWLADVVQIQQVTVTPDDGTLNVSVTYVVRHTATPATTTVRIPAPS